MRCMLTANLAVDMRFANGTQAGHMLFLPLRPFLLCCVASASAIFRSTSQGRLFYWSPGSVDGKKALPSSHPELLARFAKEASAAKAELLPDIDILDIEARRETLKIRGEPQMIQLPVVPAYALTVHKTQALSIKHRVNGCLEVS